MFSIGFISLDEFAEACELLQKHLPEHNTKEQLMEICKLMDINKDGLVDLNEFLETFRLCEQAKSNIGYGYCADLSKVKNLSNNGTISIKGNTPDSKIDINGCDSMNVNLNASSLTPSSTPNLQNGSQKVMLDISEFRIQSTDDDEEEENLDCIDDSPKKKNDSSID